MYCLVLCVLVKCRSLYRDNAGKTPYQVSVNKVTRDSFRRYMAMNPNAHDYSVAKVGVCIDHLQRQLTAHTACVNTHLRFLYCTVLVV